MKPVKSLLIVLFVAGCLVGVDCFGMEQNTGMISGKVMDDQTGEPLPAAIIELFSESDQRIVASVVTQEDGAFELLQVPFGR